jgi:hypothetical protein
MLVLIEKLQNKLTSDKNIFIKLYSDSFILSDIKQASNRARKRINAEIKIATFKKKIKNVKLGIDK